LLFVTRDAYVGGKEIQAYCLNCESSLRDVHDAQMTLGVCTVKTNGTKFTKTLSNGEQIQVLSYQPMKNIELFRFSDINALNVAIGEF